MADRACYPVLDDKGNVEWIDVEAKKVQKHRIYYCIGCLGENHSNTVFMEKHRMGLCKRPGAPHFSLYNNTCLHIPGCPYDKASKADNTSKKSKSTESREPVESTEPSPVTKVSDSAVLDITAPPSNRVKVSKHLDKTGRTVIAEEILTQLMRVSHSVARITEKKSKTAGSDEEISLPRERLKTETPNVTVQPENPTTVEEYVELLISLLPTDRYGNPWRFVQEWIFYKKTIGYYSENPNAMIGVRFGVFVIHSLRYDEAGCRVFLKAEENNHCEYVLQFTNCKIVSALKKMKFALKDLNDNLTEGELPIILKIAVFANWIAVEPISEVDCARNYVNINQNSYLGIASAYVTDTMLQDLDLIPKTNEGFLRFVLERLQKTSLTKNHFGFVKDEDYNRYIAAGGTIHL